jgi:hypothetical protein
MVLGMGEQEPLRVSFAVENEDLPAELGLDWSYAPDLVLQTLDANPALSVNDAILLVANEFGSIVSYLPIEPDRLRVYCKGNPPTNPLAWRRLLATADGEIIRHV